MAGAGAGAVVIVAMFISLAPDAFAVSEGWSDAVGASNPPVDPIPAPHVPVPDSAHTGAPTTPDLVSLALNACHISSTVANSRKF